MGVGMPKEGQATEVGSRGLARSIFLGDKFLFDPIRQDGLRPRYARATRPPKIECQATAQ